MMYTIEILNQEFQLHSSGAIYWKKEKMLLIADVHLGKVSHFRKFGAAVPAKASLSNFRKLEHLITELQPKTICFLGDLFHSSLNSEWNIFQKWVQHTSCEIILIEGNHDIIDPTRYEAMGVSVFREMRLHGFLLTHHPTVESGMFNFSGHIHPGITMIGSGRQRLTLSCFYETENQLILPAFGTFTGKYRLRPGKNDRVYVIADNEVICVT